MPRVRPRRNRSDQAGSVPSDSAGSRVSMSVRGSLPRCSAENCCSPRSNKRAQLRRQVAGRAPRQDGGRGFKRVGCGVDLRQVELDGTVPPRRQNPFKANPQRGHVALKRLLDGLPGERLGLAVKQCLSSDGCRVSGAQGPSVGIAGLPWTERAPALFFRRFFSGATGGIHAQIPHEFLSGLPKDRTRSAPIDVPRGPSRTPWPSAFPPTRRGRKAKRGLRGHGVVSCLKSSSSSTSSIVPPRFRGPA